MKKENCEFGIGSGIGTISCACTNQEAGNTAAATRYINCGRQQCCVRRKYLKGTDKAVVGNLSVAH